MTAAASSRVTLDPADRVVTLINIFTVDPTKAEDLLTLLVEATEQTMRRQPGFISASLHVSADRGHVANYAQWRDMAAFEAMQANPEARPHMKAAADLAETFEPTLYELRYVSHIDD